ncbi:MAG TPA: DUF2851 family protein [Chitinophaga sp.]
MPIVVSPAPPLAEDLLQFIWQFRLFNADNLYTTAGEPVRIISTGSWNRNDGPDFSGARIRIGNTLWAGHVEIHLRASDWYKHQHQQDRRYDRVILHVVFEQDLPHEIPSLPCVVLAPRISKLLLQRYRQLRESRDFVPCGLQAGKTTPLTWQSWSDRLLLERWDRKTTTLRGWLQQTRQDWEEICYQGLAQGFGQPVNAGAFLQLAQSLPLRILLRNKASLEVVEALLFGQAGMLEGTFADAYPQALQRHYRYLRHKYQLQPVPAYTWKWLRMRPSAFPTLRIALLAALLHQRSHLFSRLLAATHLQQLEDLLTVPPSTYWQTHYRFDAPVSRLLMPGKQLVHNILINTLLPLLYWYGQQKARPEMQERAMTWIGALPPEENRIISGWQATGMHAANAADTQALLQLKQHYCEERRCLECTIGAKLLKGSCGGA